MAVGLWVLERCANERFPYRLTIQRGERRLVLRVQDRWPGASRNVFCLRETELSDDVLEEVERVPIMALQRRGVRLSIVLDRPRNKRCDFLILKRPYRDGRPGTYEQIFWQTQSSMRQRRPRVRLTHPRRQDAYVVRIAHDEKYPWRFPAAVTERGRLPAGDYALMEGERVLAVVERKTFENFQHDLTMLPLLHQRLMELSSFERHALVIEAPYEDFLSRAKSPYLSPSFAAEAIAELFASHPRLRIVFCANRKTANEWTRRYFDAVWAAVHDRPATSGEA
ncbi:MAG TPA: ERCC4 domain-containing protein [Dehalococcoidia bacterium]|nr:ERCC4 domain-containing protein [Dehalococcoidia bacterium]